MKTKKSFYLALTLFSLAGQIAWVVENMYFNVFIYKMFHASPSEISLMVSASAVTATVTTLLIGALADKLGKRKIFICAGYILWGISILAFCLLRTDILGKLFPSVLSLSSLGVTLTVVLDCVMTFFGSSANDAAFNAWLTDSTDHSNRGKAEGINAMMPLLAILAVFGGFMGFDLNRENSWTLIFLIIGGVMIVLGILGFFLIRDPKIQTEANQNYFKNILYGFRPSVIRTHKKLYLHLISFAIFGISIQIFMPYLILYYTEALHLDNYVLIMAPAVILAAIFTLIWGRVYDKIGFRRGIALPLLLLGVGYAVLIWFTHTVPVFLGSLLMMCGYLAGMAVFGAAIRDETPENRSGMFQGLRIVGQVLIPGLIGPVIGSAVLQNAATVVNDDGTTSFIPNENIFFAALAVATALSLWLLIQFRLGRKKN